MNDRQKIIWSIVAVIAILLVIAAVGYFSGNWNSTPS